jgi:hypothetical protein
LYETFAKVKAGGHLSANLHEYSLIFYRSRGLAMIGGLVLTYAKGLWKK